MLAVRKWSVRHARGLEWFYRYFGAAVGALHPLWSRVGYARLEAPVATVERGVKGFLFDCKMCGSCALSASGMACPMNCPKNLRNGPCGGVRADGNCEVKPLMRCVWVEAVAGSRVMRGGAKINVVQPAVDWRMKNSSAWLREARRHADAAAVTVTGTVTAAAADTIAATDNATGTDTTNTASGTVTVVGTVRGVVTDNNTVTTAATDTVTVVGTVVSGTATVATTVSGVVTVTDTVTAVGTVVSGTVAATDTTDTVTDNDTAVVTATTAP